MPKKGYMSVWGTHGKRRVPKGVGVWESEGVMMGGVAKGGEREFVGGTQKSRWQKIGRVTSIWEGWQKEGSLCGGSPRK